MSEPKSSPKLFISYAWSNPEHEQWVIDLATELRESNVDVILDKWDLKEGHDSVAFMEKMVTDPQISKVAVISDKIYAEKADGRSGGVGTETQIISREVYENQDQGKFVAILPSKDENGKAYLPTYYKGRIYIDLSESDRYAENFEKLLRWIYNKPLLVKPELGSTPSFLNESKQTSLGTTASLKRCLDAIRQNKPFAAGAIDEYFSTAISNLERFRIEKNSEMSFDEQVIENIEQFLVYRNEMIQLFIAIAQYQATEEISQKLHRFFENLVPYMNRPEHISSYQEWDYDNFKFIAHELFLYAIGIFVKYEKFDFANALLTTPYYMGPNRGGNPTVSFTVFRSYMRSLEHRNERMSLRRLSVRADILKERAKSSGVEFGALMQADFILFLRATKENSSWWPETLVYSAHSYSPFEIFARATSKTYFARIKSLLGLENIEQLKVLTEEFRSDRKQVPRWQFESLSIETLLCLEHLCTKP